MPLWSKEKRPTTRNVNRTEQELTRAYVPHAGGIPNIVIDLD